MTNHFPGGVWPVMLTPFTADHRVDENALEALTQWYLQQGVDGLFSVCQSSEMFFLTLEERVQIAQTVVNVTHGRAAVIASGHVSDDPGQQLQELNAMAQTGIQALILITNRMAAQDESDAVWRERTQALLNALPADMPLGLYECPYPYKRLVSVENLAWAAHTGRFFFMKDTCCDGALIGRRLDAIQGTPMKLYNANSATLRASLLAGAAGYCGVMANFHPALYKRLCLNPGGEEAQRLSDFLTLGSLIEHDGYPVNAKYHLMALKQLPMDIFCRVRSENDLSETFRDEVRALERMALQYGEV